MQSVHKFLFDVSFDQAGPPPEPQPEPAPEPVEPVYGEADLAAARREAFAAGKAEGAAEAAAEARAGIERAVSAALTAIAEALPKLIEARAEADRLAVRTAVETAVAIARKLHPELARRHGLDEVEGVLRHCLEERREEPRLVVRIEDGLLGALGARIDPLARSLGFEGRVILLADETIAPGDCRVEWADGGVERSGAALWEEVDAAVGRALAELSSAAPAADDGNDTDNGSDTDNADTADTAAEGRSEPA